MNAIARHRTAIGRKELSRPVRLALESKLIAPGRSLLDFGCGRGTDVAYLNEAGITAVGWDPVHRPSTPLDPADIVNLGYVVNVIEDPAERAETIRRAFGLCRQLLVVAARLDFERVTSADQSFGDGVLTGRNTFQKYFTQLELRQWIDTTLGVASVAGSPGVFYIFRDELLREAYLAARYHRVRVAPRVRKSVTAFEANRELLQPFVEFVTERGRLPEPDELQTADDLGRAFGSIRKAFALVRRVTGSEQWETVRSERRMELLIRIALERFGGRVRFSELPVMIQRDVKSLCRSYTRAVDDADRLLFSVGDRQLLDAEMRSSRVGKLTGNALYVHANAISELPAVLQVYEGCARAFAGVVEAANVIKLHREVPQVSYLLYPEFDSEAHPELKASLVVGLKKCEIAYREYHPDGNPPVLHRKEEFVSAAHPERDKWTALTASEEAAGLFSDSSRIGTRDGWRETLISRGAVIRDGLLVLTPQANPPG